MGLKNIFIHFEHLLLWKMFGGYAMCMDVYTLKVFKKKYRMMQQT